MVPKPEKEGRCPGNGVRLGGRTQGRSDGFVFGGGGTPPRTGEGEMESRAMVIFKVRRQLGIDCEPGDIILVVTRLLQTGVLGRPRHILCPEVWDKPSVLAR